MRPDNPNPLFGVPRQHFVNALLILAIAAVYWPVLGYDFVYLDDDSYVFKNAHVFTGLSWPNVVWAFTTWHGGFWIPLTWLSFMLDAQVFGPGPAGFHLTNVMLHIANTLLLFAVLRALTGTLWRSAMVAALFAAHPLHVESVAWVTERKDVLSTLFLLAALRAYTRYVRTGGMGRFCAVMLLFGLGLMAKPVIVTLPLLLLVLDGWPLRRLRRSCSPGQARCGRGPAPATVILEKIPLALLAAGSGIVTILASGQAGALGLMDRLPLSIRVANAFLSYAGYIGQTMWPADLAVFYPHPGRGISFAAAGAAALFVGVVSAATVLVRKRAPYLGVGWFWYIVSLAPVIGLVQAGAQSMADRFTYVPSVGLFLMLAWGTADLLGGSRHGRKMLLLSAVAVLSFLLAVTWRAVPVWRDTVTLLEHARRVRNAPLSYNLGVYYADRREHRRAEEQFLAAVRIQPEAFDPRFNLGVVLAAQGRTEEAIVQYAQALKAEPESVKAHANLGVALTVAGRAGEALPHLQKALHADRENASGYVNLGSAYLALKQWETAAELLRSASRLDPGNEECLFNLAYASERLGRREEAIGFYRQAILSNPDSGRSRLNLGLLYLGLGRRDEALAEYRQLQGVDPPKAAALGRLLGL